MCLNIALSIRNLELSRGTGAGAPALRMARAQQYLRTRFFALKMLPKSREYRRGADHGFS